MVKKDTALGTGTMADRITDDEFERRMYSHDIAPLPKEMEAIFNTMPDFVVRPKSAKEVSNIIHVAQRKKLPVIPRGGASWGLGGCIPVKGGILLDMSTMDNIIEIDGDNLTATVEAGITWKKLCDTLERKGYFLGAYPSSAPSATVAGWINTGGVGIGTYKYGGAGDMIRNMEVVLPNGDIINTGFDYVMPNGSGYNLNWLFVGSEGTLGVVTKVTFKIYPAPEKFESISYSFNNLKQVGAAIHDITRAPINPFHMGFGDAMHYEYLRKVGIKAPKVGSLLTVTFEGAKEIVKYEEKVVDSIIAKHGGKSLGTEVGAHEWSSRSYEFKVRKMGLGAIPGEILVPMNTFSKVLDDTAKLIKKMKLKVPMIGSVADRNSVMVMPYYLTDKRKFVRSLTTMGFNKKFADIAFKHNGRPVGLGLFFACNVEKMFGREGSNLMHEIKSAIDPNDIMNPGKLVRTTTGFGFDAPGFAMNMGLGLLASVRSLLPRDTFGEKK